MPNITMTLPETQQSVTRPIVIDVVSQVKEITKINQNVPIRYYGDLQRSLQAGTALDATNRSAEMASGRYLFIEVTEDYDQNSLHSTSTRGNSYDPIFEDRALLVRVAPLYVKTTVEIAFKYRTVSKTEALRWRDDVRIHVSMMRDINLHTLVYHYLLPSEYVDLLTEIHRLRENNHGYGESFEEYLDRCSNKRVGKIGDLAGKDARLGISERQVRVQGFFDFDTVPEKAEHDEDSGSWTISFTYKFSYEKPIVCNMEYPILIHNQLLPDKYIGFVDSSINLDDSPMRYSASLAALSQFEADEVLKQHIDLYNIVRIPNFDDFVLPNEAPDVSTAFIALCSLAEPDVRTLVNLDDLGDILLDPDVRDFIAKTEYQHITSRFRSIFYIGLYVNGEQEPNGSLICTPTLDIQATKDLDPRNTHRIRLTIMSDLTKVHRDSIERLRTYPKVLAKVILAINEDLRNHPYMAVLANKTEVTPTDFGILYKILTGINYNDSVIGKQRPLSNTPIHPLDPFLGVRGSLLEYYRNNRVSQNTVMLSAILTVRQTTA